MRLSSLPYQIGCLLAVTCSCALLAPFASAGDETLTSGIDRSCFDTSKTPGDNFFQYVNGNWLKNNPIPVEYSRWGAFMKLRDDNLVALREIVEGLSQQDRPAGSDAQKLYDFYHTAMDEAKLERQGASPLAGELQAIEKINTPDDLIALAGHFHALGIESLFNFYIDQDEKQSTRYVCQLWQGGKGLPERDYYLSANEDSKRIRAAYREHVAKMLELLGDSPQKAAAGADTVLAIETRLAEDSRTPVELRDREAQYNRKTLRELAELTPKLNWALFWQALNAAGVADAIVGQPEFFQRLNEMLATVPAEDWRVYMRWHLIRATAPYLSDPFERENFHFYREVLRGVKQMQPRWKRAIIALDQHMGEALGRLYVEKHFTPAAKQKMDDLVKNVMLAFQDRLQSRDWMGPQTKQQAQAKLVAIMPKIGYPTKWRDYSELEVGADSYVRNMLRSQEFDLRFWLDKLNQRVDREIWHMTPPTVNAYYNPPLNEIVFPAGILQPPFFDPSADDAVNYGAIGAVIGHEITHGFDDQGSRSDADGNLRNWWTADDRARFNAKTDVLVKQYDACVAVDDLHVNGRLTLGENIADLGGLTIAYAAYQKSLAGKPAPVIDGFTGPQRFFIGFAQAWRESVRDEEIRLQTRTNPHAPERFRTMVPLSNFEPFYEAFDVKSDDAMFRPPNERVEIW